MVDRSAGHIASVCPDEEGIAALALEHLRATGLRRVAIPFRRVALAVARERAFVEQARAAGAEVAPGWGK